MTPPDRAPEPLSRPEPIDAMQVILELAREALASRDQLAGAGWVMAGLPFEEEVRSWLLTGRGWNALIPTASVAASDAGGASSPGIRTMTIDAARDSRPVGPDHPFQDEWAFQRSMSRGNEMAGKPIAADQPCFNCGVPFSRHGGDPRPVGEGLRERLLHWTTRVYQMSPDAFERAAAAEEHDLLLASDRIPVERRLATDQPASTEAGEDG